MIREMKADSLKLQSNDLNKMLLILTAGYIAIALWLGVVLKFDFLQSDVLGYWKDSLRWTEPFNSYHVPGYPLMIAFLRGISFGMVPPLVLMKGINFVALVSGALLVYRILQNSQISDPLAVFGAYLFGLWPFVGLVYAVHPLADLPAMALLLGGIFALQRSRVWLAGMLMGLSMLTQKGVWALVAFILLAYLLYRKPRLSWQLIAALFLLVVPLSALSVFGASHNHGSIFWIVSRSLEYQAVSRSSLPVLDGLVETLKGGGSRAIVKGGLIISLAGIAALLLVIGCWKKQPYRSFTIAIAAAVLFSILILNESQLWASVRFSRLLVLPLMWNVKNYPVVKVSRLITILSKWLILILLFLSQFAFSWYMAGVYFE